VFKNIKYYTSKKNPAAFSATGFDMLINRLAAKCLLYEVDSLGEFLLADERHHISNAKSA
jgi:hypothetical protein